MLQLSDVEKWFTSIRSKMVDRPSRARQRLPLYMRPSLRRFVFGSLGGSIGVAGVLFAGALYVVDTLTRPKKRSSFDLYVFSPYELGLPAEAVVFPPLHGDYKVNGWYVASPGTTTTILICPGYRSSMSDILGMIAHLWKAGHNVLAFEYYGHGVEVGIPVTLGYREINDFLGAVAYARSRAPQTRLGVIGYSMGAAVAIMSCALNNDVEAVVTDSAFASHWGVVSYNFRRAFHIPYAPFSWPADYLLWRRAGYHFSQVEPLRDIARIAPRPILIIHGGKDTIVDPQDASLLYAAASDPKELWVVPEADHCGAYFANRSAYVERVLAFFDLHLKQNRPHLQLLENTSEEQAPAGHGEDATNGLSEAS